MFSFELAIMKLLLNSQIIQRLFRNQKTKEVNLTIS